MLKREQYSAFVLPLIVFVLAVVALQYLSSVNYLLFHSLAEFFSIGIAVTMFVIAWNTSRFSQNKFLLALGIAYLFISVIDLLHTLAYSGMGVFPGYDANLPTQLWLAGRYLESFSLLIVPFVINRPHSRWAYFSAYLVVTSILVISVFIPGLFPVAYVMETGLTPFKIMSEYFIVTVLILAILQIGRYTSSLGKSVLLQLRAAIIVTILAELSFTLYVDVYGFFNMMGHLLKILSFFLIYRAMVQEYLAHPFDSLFRELKMSEVSLRESNELLLLSSRILSHDIGHELSASQLALELFGQSQDPEHRSVSEAHLKSAVEVLETLRSLQYLATAEVDLRPVNVREFVEEIIQPLQLPVSITGNCVVLADRALKSVIGNIVRNAIQHSKTDRLEIELRDTSPTRCDIRITDFGIGLDQTIAERLVKGDIPISEEGDRGVGLYITRKLIDRYNGQLLYETTPSEGTTFTIVLRKADEFREAEQE